MERTLILVKTDGVQRGLIGDIISRFEKRGLKLVALKLMRLDDDTARRHYGKLVKSPFFSKLVEFITSEPLVAMVWEGEKAVRIARNMIGDTDPVKSPAGTIRADFGISIGRNLVHGSDALESAHQEINLFFSPKEVLDYSRGTDPWIQEP